MLSDNMLMDVEQKVLRDSEDPVRQIDIQFVVVILVSSLTVSMVTWNSYPVLVPAVGLNRL